MQGVFGHAPSVGVLLKHKSRARSSPDQLSGLVVWLKSDAGTFSDAGTTPATDGVAVQQWSDQSGSGNHVVQGTAALRPTLQTNEVNGRPLLQFNGDWIQRTFGAAIPQPYTIVIVRRINTIAGTTYLDAKTFFSTVMDNPAATNSPYRAYAGAALQTSGNIATTDWEVQTVVYNGASSTMRINGRVVATGNVGSGSMDGLTLGARADGSTTAHVDYTDVLVYNRIVNATDLLGLERYMGALNAIAVA